ncbi:MAG: hypothetical protein JSW58_08145 [Candidatus Latescibacterota bacterium]|nr:MAG: hypothetical protein JSW58_08145 [Candidatus Latescibacterota bacterium]
MHLANLRWWIYCSGRWPRYFLKEATVIEIGSANINGSIRPIFDAEEYLGVDWREDRDVDYVALAHKLPGEDEWDAVVSASMLEHDPHWRASLTKMVKLLRSNGALFLSWGVAGNPRHCAPQSPDYAEAKARGDHLELHHARPAGQVLELLESLGMHLQEFRYEDSLPFNRGLKDGILVWDGKALPRQFGAQYPLTAENFAVLVAFKSRMLLSDPRFIDALRPADQ